MAASTLSLSLTCLSIWSLMECFPSCTKHTLKQCILTEYVYLRILHRQLLKQFGSYTQCYGQRALAVRVSGGPSDSNVRYLRALRVAYKPLWLIVTIHRTSTKSSLIICSSSRVPGSSGSLIVLIISSYMIMMKENTINLKSQVLKVWWARKFFLRARDAKRGSIS